MEIEKIKKELRKILLVSTDVCFIKDLEDVKSTMEKWLERDWEEQLAMNWNFDFDEKINDEDVDFEFGGIGIHTAKQLKRRVKSDYNKLRKMYKEIF